MPEFSETFLIILSEVFMESKTFIQLNTLPAGYNGFVMTADFRVQRKVNTHEQAKQKIIR